MTKARKIGSAIAGFCSSERTCDRAASRVHAIAICDVPLR